MRAAGGLPCPALPQLEMNRGKIRREWNGGDWYKREKSRGLAIVAAEQTPEIRKYVRDLVWAIEECD
jgi:hypothetical protein